MRSAIRDCLMAVGAWHIAALLALWLTVALIPINNRLVYDGDVGVLLMHVWSAFPPALFAAVAGVVVVTASSGQRRLLPVAVLTLLFGYSGAMKALAMNRGWVRPPARIDQLSLLIDAILPALTCVVASLYWTRRSRGRV